LKRFVTNKNGGTGSTVGQADLAAVHSSGIEYEKANRARAEIARKLSTLPDGVGELIRRCSSKAESELRHYWSMAPVAVWAVVAAAVCVATYFAK
jgi:hypothetical protein